jgi:hypothetical protein
LSLLSPLISKSSHFHFWAMQHACETNEP